MTEAQYNGYKLGKRSKRNLEGVNPDLRAVVELAIERAECDFAVIDGVRTYQRQQTLVKEGKSKTVHSRHLTGHAVDLAAWVDGGVSWDWPHYDKIAAAMKAAAADLNIPLEWGGDWSSFRDGPHFQLPRNAYPGGEIEAVVTAPVYTTGAPTVEPVSSKPTVSVVTTTDIPAGKDWSELQNKNSLPAVPAKPGIGKRIAQAAGVVAGVMGVSAGSGAFDAVVPVVDQIASGVSIKDALLAGVAGWLFDRTRKA